MSGERGLAIYDLDGVITRRDTFTALVMRRLLRTPARLLRAAPVAVPMLRGHEPHRHETARRIAEIAMTGLGERAYAAQAEAFGHRIGGDPGWLRADAIDRLRRQHADGVRIVIATASERFLAAALLASAEVPYDLLSASSLSETPSGMRVTDHRVGARKTEALHDLGVPVNEAEFVTDSLTDLPTARTAARVVLIGASTKTRVGYARAGVTTHALA